MNLKTIREIRGMSRRELAKRTGISFRTVQDYEQGHKELSSAKAETVRLMAEALGCSMEQLLSEEELSEKKPRELFREEKDRGRAGEGISPEKHRESQARPGNTEGTESYFLMHRDERVAALQMEPLSGALVSVPELYARELLPPGTEGPAVFLKYWWQKRAVPLTQGNMKKILALTGFLTPQAYLLKTLGLSMEDHYWLRPLNRELFWREMSFFSNDFEDLIGAMQFSGLDAQLDLRNFEVRFPSASAGGESPKTWLCTEDGRRLLVKGAQDGNTQQLFNEVVAAYIHRKQGRFPYVDYRFHTLEYGQEKELGVSAEAFSNENLEFISAGDLIRSQELPGKTDYERFTAACVRGGLDRETVQSFLDYQILTDFMISNTERSYEDFGVLRNTNTLRFVGMAPIFGSGKAMLHALERTRRGLALNSIPEEGFIPDEAEMLRLVKDTGIVDPEKLLTGEELDQVLLSSARTPEEIRFLSMLYERKRELLLRLRKGDRSWMR